MRLLSGKFLYSPSDLITFMESPFASWMEKAKILDPSFQELMDPEDEMLKLLQKKGYEHEADYLEVLKETGREIHEISSSSPEEIKAETSEAMKAGRDVITQAYLALEPFAGFADLLVREKGESRLGAFHYEVWDTKLSGKMKPYYAIQLCCYSEMLQEVQELMPISMSIILGDHERKVLKLNEYYSYYQVLKSAFLEYHQKFDLEAQPDPASSREFGRWSSYAESILNQRDHLSLVANISRNQIKRLQQAGIQTVQQLAETEKISIPKIEDAVFERFKIQSRLQIKSRGLEKPDYQVLLPEGKAQGLAILPPQSCSDLFFDIEGFPLHDGGLEYLWGVTYFDEAGNRQFRDFWAHDHDQEKQALIDFIGWVYPRWLAYPSMHIYHYASYEKTALRKLMGRYGVCEHEVDTLLRNQVFVDIYTVVRNGVLVGEPSYSLKNVELLYRDHRETDVKSGGESVLIYDEWRNGPDGMDWSSSEVLKRIRDYNIDDCNSTQELTEWLRLKQKENKIVYLGHETSEELDDPDEEETDVTRLRDDLLNRADQEIDEEHQALLRNLAWMLEFHKRENKPTWWRLYDRMGRNELDLKDDMDCLVDLRRTEKKPYLPTPRSRNHIYEYQFNPDQPFKGQSQSFYVLGEENLKVRTHEFRRDEGLIEIQCKEEQPGRISLVPDEFISPLPIPEAIQSVIESLLDKGFPDCALTDFLRRKRPRIKGNKKGALIDSDISGHELINEMLILTQTLDNSYLCIQGPPGSGKTYTAKHIIGELLKSGKRIGITSNSHKAILNLMKGVSDYVETHNIEARLIKAGGDKNDPVFESTNISYTSGARDCYDDAKSSSVCIGGTAWFFCNFLFDPTGSEKGFTPFDYIFIDEAGQVSLANLVGMSRSCRNIILMGDQMQLSQPIQGSHPGETGWSILEYLLQEEATIPADLGIFLPRTYRMHPDVCSLISNQVYEGRLESDSSALKHVIETSGPLIKRQSGICFIPVEHEGNTQGSDEEVEVITSIAKELLGSYFWAKKGGTEKRELGWNDVLFVAPYNYQVNLLRKALGAHAKVGSVDLFQGQEAPVVVISMCSSDASESPRGIEFLFSKNRMNVALSRAQALAVVVGSPRLGQTQVNSIEQMSLVNLFNNISNT